MIALLLLARELFGHRLDRELRGLGTLFPNLRARSSYSPDLNPRTPGRVLPRRSWFCLANSGVLGSEGWELRGGVRGYALEKRLIKRPKPPLLLVGVSLIASGVWSTAPWHTRRQSALLLPAI